LYTVNEFYVGDSNPMYVQNWRTDEASESSANDKRIVLVHGGAHTGMCWTRCPDGRPGWAQLLCDAGWSVYVIDWPGVGRSRHDDRHVGAGPAPVVSGIVELLSQIGSATVFAHSIGAVLAMKAADIARGTVSAFAAIAPAPPANVPSPRGLVPTDRALEFDLDEARKFLMNADQFPKEHEREYFRTLCDYSPTIMNALGSADGSDTLWVDPATFASIPAVVLVGKQDHLTPPSLTQAIAAAVGMQHVIVDDDWNLPGFGHSIPIERDSNFVLGKLLTVLSPDAPRTRAGVDS
jgi:pimeloyl-ACP methyl ester carboxylesterase